MRRTGLIGGLTALGAVLLLVSGCYRPPWDVTWHEPHVYKGKQDPLLAKMQGGEPSGSGNGFRRCRRTASRDKAPKEGLVMIKRTITSLVLLAAVLVLATGCQQIREPWVREGNQLEQERARSDAARQELRHRLLWVQTDR